VFKRYFEKSDRKDFPIDCRFGANVKIALKLVYGTSPAILVGMTVSDTAEIFAFLSDYEFSGALGAIAWYSQLPPIQLQQEELVKFWICFTRIKNATTLDVTFLQNNLVKDFCKSLKIVTNDPLGTKNFNECIKLSVTFFNQFSEEELVKFLVQFAKHEKFHLQIAPKILVEWIKHDKEVRSPKAGSILRAIIPPKQEVTQNDPNIVTCENEPKLSAYFKMAKLGVPIQSIKDKMMMNGYDPALLNTPNAPSPFIHPPKQKTSIFDSSDDEDDLFGYPLKKTSPKPKKKGLFDEEEESSDIFFNPPPKKKTSSLFDSDSEEESVFSDYPPKKRSTSNLFDD